jgi:hypothetical protein
MTKSWGAEYCGKPRSALAYAHDFRTAIIVGQRASPLVSAIKDRKGMTRLGNKKWRAHRLPVRAPAPDAQRRCLTYIMPSLVGNQVEMIGT